MNTLHILKTQPDDTTMSLITAFEGNKEATLLTLDDSTDYERLIDIIFEHDQVISWW
jgi:hypothetical protein